MRTRTRPAAARPPIHLVEAEADALTGLALKVESTAPALADMLLAEIDRATIHAEADLPRHVVRMGSTVTFVDEGNGATRIVQLVYPPQADIAAGRISILTPIGAGLIGLAQGAAILWPDRSGQERRLRILKVSPPGTT